jgi:leucyl-tRNA synthetase
LLYFRDKWEKYNHKDIEKKWQEKWEEEGIYKTQADSSKPKQYILDMFPYPSGEGLHVGHPRGYIATDVYSRMKRMKGFNVLHPMGWDAFGLPAENFAIKNKIHPRVAVEKNIARFKEQLSLIGLDYDWSHEVDTTDPKFYKWTQWIFLQMFKKGLAYESHEPINWCPSCQTGLANEDVNADGTCERCGTVVEKKPVRQWVLKITDYADRMLADLDKLPKWPDGVKEAQRNWIGKSEGAEIDFPMPNQPEHPIKVFTTRPDTIFGATFIAISAGLASKWMGMGWKATDEVKEYIEKTLKEEAVRDFKEKEKTGIYAGFDAINPSTKEPIPVWIASYVMSDVGTGAIMAVPAHDERDFEFAKKYNLPIVEVIKGKKELPRTDDGELINSGEFNGSTTDEAKKKITEFVGGKLVNTYKIKDWIFSRQRYWGEPIPLIHCEKCGVVAVPEKDLPVLLPEVENYEPAGTGESPLANIADWVNVKCPSCGGNGKRETNTMPQWAGSSWYYLRYIDPDNNEVLVDNQKEKDWMPVDVYVGGDHATRHLIYARFWHKFLFDIGAVSTEEPFPRLEFLGFILAEDGRKMSKRWKNVVTPDEMVERFGADSFRLFEMFIGPFESTAPWSTDGLVGTSRFLEKVWRLKERVDKDKKTCRTDNLVEKTIKGVSEEIEGFKFNTVISKMMILVNTLEKEEKVTERTYKILLQLLSPFAPHITEELWKEMGEDQSIHLSDWPKYDESKIVDNEFELVLQVNGKKRGSIVLANDISEDEIKKIALEDESVKRNIEGKEILRVVVVPKKLINIVVK